MSLLSPPDPSNLDPESTREIVGEFSDRSGLQAAVRGLIAEGFDRTDISVLATHDSLEVAGPIAGYSSTSEAQSIATAFTSELPWLGPLAIAGTLLAATGPIGLAVAAVVGAAAGVVALRPVLSEVTEAVHAERFSEAIQEGRILLWVRTPDKAAVLRAEHILVESGGQNLARVSRLKHEEETSSDI